MKSDDDVERANAIERANAKSVASRLVQDEKNLNDGIIRVNNLMDKARQVIFNNFINAMRQGIESTSQADSSLGKPEKTRPIDQAKHARNDWLLALRGLSHKPKMSESELSIALAKACETHVDWVHIEPSTISTALREAYTRATGKKWPFDGRGRKKLPEKTKPKNTRKR